MIQKMMVLNGIFIPYLIIEDQKYYPVSYISTKFLLRNTNMLTRETRDKYKDLIKRLTVDYGENTGGFQETYCVPEKVLMELVSNIKIGKLTSEQIIQLDKLREYLNMDLNTESQYELTLSSEYLKGIYEKYARITMSLKFIIISQRQKVKYRN